MCHCCNTYWNSYSILSSSFFNFKWAQFFPPPLFWLCWTGYHLRSSEVFVPLVLGGIADAVFDLASAAARKPALCESCSIPKCGLQFVTKPFNIAASFLKKLFQGCWVLAFQHLFHSCGFLLLSLVLFVWAMPLIVQNCSYGLFCHSVISSENSTNNILPQKVYIKTVIVFLVPPHIFLYLLSGICNHFVLVLPSLTSWINLVYYWQDKSCFVVFSAF